MTTTADPLQELLQQKRDAIARLEVLARARGDGEPDAFSTDEFKRLLGTANKTPEDFEAAVQKRKSWRRKLDDVAKAAEAEQKWVSLNTLITSVDQECGRELEAIKAKYRAILIPMQVEQQQAQQQMMSLQNAKAEAFRACPDQAAVNRYERAAKRLSELAAIRKASGDAIGEWRAAAETAEWNGDADNAAVYRQRVQRHEAAVAEANEAQPAAEVELESAFAACLEV
jgi:hypothetical protein